MKERVKEEGKSLLQLAERFLTAAIFGG